MDLRKVKKLIELVEESGIAELEVRNGEEAIRIAMPRGGSSQAVAHALVEQAPHSAARAAAPERVVATVAAPMAGTFFRAPNPEADPFVEIGRNVQVDDVLCIIESMKMMHEIKAQESGRVVEICVANGQPISTGDILFKIS